MWWPAKINKEETDKLIRALPEDAKHYSLIGECSNNNVDFVYDVMAKSSIDNFVKSLQSRTALLAHHDTKSIIGFSNGGEFREENGKMSAIGNFSVQRNWKYMGIDTEEFIKGVQGGSLLDLSIGARIGKRVCGIESCGKEKMSFLAWLFGMGDDDDTYCSEHIAGEEYDGEIATNVLEDCRLTEVSSVYSGACPDSQFLDKVCNLADMNKDVRVSAEDIRDYGIYLPEIGEILENSLTEKPGSISLPSKVNKSKEPEPTPQTGKTGGNEMELEDKVQEIRTQALELSPGLPSDPASALEQFIKTAGEWKAELAKLQNAEIESKHKVEAYDETHEAMIKEALESGVKALGDDFDTETWKGMLQNSKFKEIAAYKKHWDSQHDENAGPDGKKIGDGKEPEGKDSTAEPGQYDGAFSLPGASAWLGN